MAVDHPLAVLELGAGLQRARVRARDVGFGHREAGADLAVEQRFEPLGLLLRGPVDLGLLGQAVTMEPLPFGGVTSRPAASATGTTETVTWLRYHAWSFPSELPDGWTVTSVRWSGDESRVLEVDVSGADGTSLVVTEQQGRLERALGRRPTSKVGGRQVYVLSFEPWHVVWQADGTVVQVVGSQSSGSGETLWEPFLAAPSTTAYPRGSRAAGTP